MSQVKTHNRDFFFKYFSFDGAKKTLENRTFLYKAPAFFNDPFDSQVILQPGISEEEFRNIFYDVMTTAILERRPEPRMGLTPEALASVSHIDKESLFEIKDTILSMLPKDNFLKMHRQAAEEQWQYLRNNFVFCVTEEFDNLLMWSHYANEHKGVVLKIKCIEEKESLLCAALKVNYSDRYPIFGDIDIWRHFLSTGEFPDLTKTYNELITTKSTHWKYENEWRMVFPRHEDSGKEFALLSFHPEEIEAIFLGCRMLEQDKSEIINLVRRQYPLAKIYQARRSDSEFRLHFSEI